MMGGTRDNPPVCSCCPTQAERWAPGSGRVTVYGWGKAVEVSRDVAAVWIEDGWSLDPPEFLPRP